jgi:hypothetical protein
MLQWPDGAAGTEYTQKMVYQSHEISAEENVKLHL